MRPEVRSFTSRSGANILKILGTTTTAIALSFIVSLVGFVGQLLHDLVHRKGGAHVLPIIASALLSWSTGASVGVTVVAWLYIWLRAASQTITQDHAAFETLKAAVDDVRQEKDAEITELKAQLEAKKKVHLDITISEVYILPEPDIAHCFIKASIHNLTEERPITIPEYEACLTIGGKKYRRNRPESDLTGFRRAYFEWEDYPIPRPVVTKTKPLVNLKMEISDAYPLKTGMPKSGWLHFTVVGVPEWPVHREPYDMHEELDQEGNEITVQDTIDTLKTTNVEHVELRVRDPFGDWHSTAKEKPLHPQNRGIVRAMDADSSSLG